jgi:protein-disulfide isomerase
MSRVLAAALFITTSFAAVSGATALAQTAVGGAVSPFKDTSMLKPPAGAKVAIIEWEDLECPACAHAFPLVHQASDHYKIPLVRHDFLIPGHMWSREAAVYARYLQDKVSEGLGTEYRREVFASQFRIASKDDLVKFTQAFFSKAGKQMPFVVDPSGQLLKEVEADKELGDKLGVNETPTIIVVSPKGWIQVKDTMDLYQAIDQAEASMGGAASAPAVKKTVARK